MNPLAEPGTSCQEYTNKHNVQVCLCTIEKKNLQQKPIYLDLCCTNNKILLIIIPLFQLSQTLINFGCFIRHNIL